ncbi:hypothetical protein M8R19_21620 [Pseudomonas sp. R3.Fl]|uniref:hypothetical protein n=1 Tax=Pseudomonas sp. R3.Fl TaxID=2928708 RepID=UPI00201E0738|nr:hypothetical protein [Pseudomonas sp. R3.Fl]MCL6691303.1 hypothetical protein [Pseudomonas sp. R3.Fl]
MAVNTNDNLSRILSDTKIDNRRDIWLWFILIRNGVDLGPYISFDRGMRDKIADALHHDRQLKIAVLEEVPNQLLPDVELKWITEEKRQLEWINTKILEKTNISHLKLPRELSGRTLTIALIDLMDIGVTAKKILLEEIKGKWSEQKANDKLFSWFKDDKEKCELAWEWIRRNEPSRYLPKEKFEDLEDLLMFFDRTKFRREQCLYYIEKIKKSHSQAKYKSRLKDKKQYNFILHNKTIESLDRIANAYEISRARAIEILVEMEEFKKEYIPEKIKNIKLLNGD